MSAAPAFSVVVTSYNYRDFVAEAVDGALAQSHAPLEVVVVDDGSTDGSPDYLRERYGSEPRVKLLCGENGGQLAAFQRGLAAAEGEVVCFLDADDRWGPDYLRQLGEVFAARKDVDFVFSDVRLVGNESGVQGYAKQAVDLGHTVLGTWVYARWYGAPTSALALRRGLARRVLDLPPEFAANWRISADNCLVFGASIVAASFPLHGTDLEGVMQAADDALYASKHGGRGMLSFARVEVAPAPAFAPDIAPTAGAVM